ncbi:MAG: NAD(P)H-dependent oxidoreductase subunit E [Synechococcus sp.]
MARTMRLPPSHVVGVASFYHLFRRQPAPPHRCAVCLGTACFVRGGQRLRQQLQQRLRHAGLLGPGSPWDLEESGCVGACGQAPVLVVDGTLAGPLPLEPGALAPALAALGLPGGAGPEPGEEGP